MREGGRGFPSRGWRIEPGFTRYRMPGSRRIRNVGDVVSIVWIASGERPNTTGKWEWPKKHSGKSVWRKTLRASISPKM